ncbi:hypothetical protein ASG17_01040 [Brevundimonas sp. Leaf363]|nr:hypothetical protein ASG17_01040 [Brevundimonas sp. Leaf363]
MRSALTAAVGCAALMLAGPIGCSIGVQAFVHNRSGHDVVIGRSILLPADQSAEVGPRVLSDGLLRIGKGDCDYVYLVPDIPRDAFVRRGNAVRAVLQLEPDMSIRLLPGDQATPMGPDAPPGGTTPGFQFYPSLRDCVVERGVLSQP